LFLAILTAYPVRAQESGQQALSNIELEYTYSDGGAVVLKIGDGILGYRWIAGPSAGYEVTERRYQSRKIAAEVYLVNWHDSENSDYVNLVIDLNEMVVHGSALAAYDSETPFAFFDLAKIARVERLER
jgi:phenolic acid decarboxylase